MEVVWSALLILTGKPKEKCGLGLERGPPSLVRTIGKLLDREVADLIKKVNIIRLDGA